MSGYSTKSDRVPPALRKQILERDGFRCVKCGFYSSDRLGLLHIDHKHPKSLGGPTVPENLRTLCGDCNLKRRNKVPECPNCGQWVVEDKPFCPSCSHTLIPQIRGLEKEDSRGSGAILQRLRQMSLRRMLLFILGVCLLTFALSLIAFTAITSLLASITNRARTFSQPSVGGASCSIVDASGRANLKSKCDTLDCDNDPSTVVGKIQAGSSVRTTGKTVSSSVPAAGEWMEIVYKGQTYYVASTKLSYQ